VEGKLPDQCPPPGHSLADASPELLAVLKSASRLQEMVPDAVLVGGSAAALYAGHRDSYYHDHVLADLRDRFDVVLEALESEGEWVTNRVVAGKVILGQLGDIEAGVRQMIRVRPLETMQVALPSGRTLTVPTAAETLRVKGFLIVRRNQTRDYLDAGRSPIATASMRRRESWPGSTTTTRTSTAGGGASPRSWPASSPALVRKTHP
jgi:hypothetical protein